MTPTKPSKLNRDNVRRNLPNATRQDLHWLLKAARKELKRRGSRNEELAAGWLAFSRAMGAAAWAMACRAELRDAHDHPRIGKNPASGEMWLPAELVKTVRLSVKERGFSALTAPNYGQLKAQWAAYLYGASKQLGDGDVDNLLDVMANGAGGSIGRGTLATPTVRHTAFRVAFSKGEAVRRITP